MATTAFVGILPASAYAQEVIDGGATETVIGGGGGTQASPWNISGELHVGDVSTGTLEISNGGSGGSVSSDAGYIGRSSTGQGDVSVDGTDSNWTSSGQIWVGYDGVGELNISGGARVSDTTGNIAFDPASIGVVTVTGADSSWENVNTIYVAEGGTGYLTVSDSGSVSVGPLGGAIRIANDAGAYGEVTVTGAGSKLEVPDGDLTVGYGGTGLLNIQDLATVTADDVTIGRTSTAVGTVNVESGGVLDVSASGSTLTIGYSSGSEGTLTVSDGLVDVGRTTTLGDHSGSSGVLEISSASGQLQTRNLFVGEGGTGTLNVVDGTVTVDVDMTVGAQAGSSGEVVNDGGVIDVGFDLSVGDFGTGTMVIENGGTLSTGGFTNIGEITGMGALTVTGTGTTWNIGNLTYVGTGGTGNIVISDDAQVNDSGFALYLGSHDSAGLGTLQINNADWSNVGQVLLGGDPGAQGALTIEAGGTLSSDDHVFIGDLGDGIALVAGSGSSLSASGGLYLGNSVGGTGTLSIEDGGEVVIGDNITIAADDSTVGTLDITGQTSRLETGNELLVGDRGTGTLNIIDGSVYADSTVSLGYAPDGEGTVLVDGATASLSSNSALFIAEEGTGSLTIANGGTVSVSGRTYLGYNAASDGVLNIGAAAGESAEGSGTLDTAELWFGDHEDARLVFNHTDTDYAFEADMIGEGRIYHVAGETRLAGDSSGFSGVTSISGGALLVNGSLGGNIVAMSGGVLGGSGTFSGLVSMESGGILAPGNSIGTAHIGNMIFNSGSIYEVEIRGGGNTAGVHNDLLEASGSVTINGGTVRVTPENGADDGSAYDAPETYTILTAGSITGRFGDVTDDYVFLDFTDSYDAENVYLTSEQVADVSDIADTPNQEAGAPALEDPESDNPIHEKLIALTGNEEDARAVLDDLTGEIHSSAKTAILEDSRFLREAAMDRLRFTLGGVATRRSGQADGQLPAGSGIWGRGFGSWSQWASDGNAAAMDRSIGGFLMGGDAPVWDSARLGVLGGYSRSSFNVSDRNSTATADTYTLGVYGGGNWETLTLTGGLAHSWHSLATSRSVSFGDFSDSLAADYSARTLQAWGEAAYSFKTDAVEIEPFVNLAHVHLTNEAFTERGGAAALNIGSTAVDATFMTLGLRGQTEVALGNAYGTLRGMVGWRHAFGDAPTSRMAFASGGGSFSIAGVSPARDSLVVDIGWDVNLADDATLGFAYGGQFGSSVQEHSANLNLNLQF
ncbi:autotransporter domain-containing protein [Nitratireductor basaltis]|nr:autotransporter domain-containing protein [Nitratireductor basaltis]